MSVIEQEKRLNLIAERECLFNVYGDDGENLHPLEMALDLELSPKGAEDWVLNKLAEAKLGGKTTAIITVDFDTQENQEWSLRHARFLLAKKLLKNNSIEANVENIRDAIESDSIFLVASINLDYHDQRAWKQKVGEIASYNVASRYGNKNRFGIVDLIIANGNKYKDTLIGNEQEFIQTVSSESYGLIDERITIPKNMVYSRQVE